MPLLFRMITRDIPIFFIGDDVFLVGTWLTKPFLRKNLTKEERIKQDVLFKMLLEYAPKDGTVFEGATLRDYFIVGASMLLS